MRHVIVGSGPAGIAAATTLRRVAPAGHVTLVSAEAAPFYSKVLTSYFVAGTVPYEHLVLADEQQLAGKGIELLAGKRALRVDPAARLLEMEGGVSLAYDRLLLATGASPGIPPIEGASLPGVFTLWSLQDALRLKKWVGAGQRAVVLGAGPVGLKAAEALLIRGLSVTAVEMMDRVLPQLLGRDDATIVQSALERKGLLVRTGSSLGRIEGDDRVRRAVLVDGQILECDVLVLAAGARPNLDLARSAGAAVNRGVLVDEFLETAVPHVYAAGDVAEAWDLARGRSWPNPTWGNASEQGRIAACNMAGQRKSFAGAVGMNSFTFLGFSMACLGITQPDQDIYRVESYREPSTGDYRKLVLLGDRIVGAVAMGDLRMAGIWRGLIARRGHEGAFASRLLRHPPGFAALSL